MKQRYEIINEKVKSKFDLSKKHNPELLETRLTLSWAAWVFGSEPLADICKRLKAAGINAVELPGTHFTRDLGLKSGEVISILEENDMICSGIYGVFDEDRDFSSPIASARQSAIDYVKREVEFAEKIGASYVSINPVACKSVGCAAEGAVMRSAEAIYKVADSFDDYNVLCALQPSINGEADSIKTIDEIKDFINLIGHASLNKISASLFDMQLTERNIAQAVINAGNFLINLHVADSNRRVLGEGHMDIDSVIMALYIMRYNQLHRFISPEICATNARPLHVLHVRRPAAQADKVVKDTVAYFRQREEILLA